MGLISPQIYEILIGIFSAKIGMREAPQNTDHPVYLIFDWASLSLSRKCQNKQFFKDLMKIAS